MPRVGVIFGGRSGEHEVSLASAASIIAALERRGHEVVPIGIARDGRWVVGGDPMGALAEQARGALPSGDDTGSVKKALADRAESVRGAASTSLVRSEPAGSVPSELRQGLDVVFIALHGPYGEDGTIQGLLELADIPYVGAGVLGSAAGMDKDIMKSLFRAAGLPIVKHVTFLRGAWEDEPKKVHKFVEKNLKYPVFVKPANLGSSVGISKAHNREELGPAIEEAAKFDRKIVIEESVGGKKHKAREIECSVLGNDKPQASVPGEIVPCKEFYDYNAKYLEEGSTLVIPAKLTRSEAKKVQELAIRAFQAVDCSGLARVDFLMDAKTRKIYLNEINTMPGFTSISMYPKLWAASGVSYPELIGRLIQLGLERHQDKKKNQYSR